MIKSLMTLGALLTTLAWSQPIYQTSDHFDGEVFFNPAPFKDKTFGDFLKWTLNREAEAWPDSVDVPSYPAPTPRLKNLDEIRVTFINHSTVLLQIGDVNILTDPIFSERASPVSFAGPKRVHAPGVAFKDLPPIDLVLVSHIHYDHMDEATLKDLAKRDKPVAVTGLGNKSLLTQWGFTEASELDWEESIQWRQFKIHFVEAQHFSARGLFDRNQTLWGGFMIETPHGFIYFAGDTGYGDFYKKLASKYQPILLSFIPIGAYLPRWFMAPVHLDPPQAVQVHRDLKSQKSIGIHWGTFPMADEGRETPVRDLRAELEKHPLPGKEDFIVLQPGEALSLSPPHKTGSTPTKKKQKR